MPGGQRLDIPADGHLGYRKEPGKLGDRTEAAGSDLLDYALAPRLRLRGAGPYMLQIEHPMCESLHIIVWEGPLIARRVVEQGRGDRRGLAEDAARWLWAVRRRKGGYSDPTMRDA